VNAAPVFTSANSTTFSRYAASSFRATTTGTPAPTIMEMGPLPNGVLFNTTTDELVGTPTEAGIFPITFTAFNGVGPIVTQSFTLRVLGLHVTTTSLPDAIPGTHYAVQLEAAGALPPLKWSKTSGVLPKGLKVRRGGVLEGTVKTAAPATYSFQVTVLKKGKPREEASATLTLKVG